jgi:molybdate transport system substrate-binding protein
MKMLRLGLAAVVFVMLAVGGISAQDNQTLVVFGAASLADAYEEIALAFEEAHPGVDVVYNFGGTSQLAAQINEGAPVDVFASANTRQMQVVRETGRVTATPRRFVTNRLVVIVPDNNPARIETLADLARPGILLVLAAPGVPVRDYTDEMIVKMSASDEYGADFGAAVMANLVSEEDNVRQVAAKIALGEADAGVVYASDVTPDLAANVLVLDVPDTFNTVAAYPIATVSESANPATAQAFVDFMFTEPVQCGILKRWNFIPVRKCE